MAIPQINLYFTTNEVTEHEYNDAIDDLKNFDCIDRSDENSRFLHSYERSDKHEPAFAFEDVTCESTFLTNNSVSDKCWSALKCYFALSYKNDSEITNDIIDNDCIPTMKETCPDMLYNSLKCISFHRLMNGISDCPYNDDENIFEETNLELFEKLKFQYYQCYFTGKYIPQSAILNTKCDCGRLENFFCEDENEIENFTKRTVSFQTICDGFQELYPLMIDDKNETDETKCEQWECDNIYTHCDGIWNCLYGEDEMNCNSSPVLLNCSSDQRLCVTRNTSELTCLSINKINDGIVDCLGGTDEQNLCPPTVIYRERRFYCMNKHPLRCLKFLQLCNGYEDCLYGDDEQFCQKNRTMSMYNSICKPEYLSLASDVEKFLCNASTSENYKATVKYFTINRFHESFHNEINDNQQLNVITLDDYKPIPLLDNPRCHRGLDVRIWLNKSSNIYTSGCLCPPSYYGKQCQYQNQRLSLSIRFHASVQSRKILFLILILLLDNTNQQIIHSYEQFTYLSIRDCKMKFNIYLLYSTRPKYMNRTYSIHMNIYEQHSLQYRGSFFYALNFLFLPVHRLAFIVNIPFENNYQICSNRKCYHGKCIKYFNTKETFCLCEQGWSGQHCHIPFNCTCSSNSLCIGTLNNHRSICICRENYFGSQCYIRDRICDRNSCENNGLCIAHDDFMLSTNQNYFCICPKGFSEKQCQRNDTQINLVFDKNLFLSHSVFIHFITIIPLNPFAFRMTKSSPQRLTTLQTISQATNTLRIYWSQPFHLVFIETLDKTFYLTITQSIYNYSRMITKTIDLTHRCPSINELVSKTFAQLHLLHRIKSYHLICQQYSPNLSCFHDDIHFCLCYDHQNKRLANCFQFDHHMKFDCFGRNECENDGQCFQDSPDCPKRSICICRSCYYGNRCQFTTSEFGLSLDAILAYHIIPDANISHQTSIVKLNLRRLVCDIEDDKTSITAVCRYYEAFNEIQMMITSGPSLNLVDYLVELDRLDDAHRYFKQIHDEDQHRRSGQLYNIGLKKLIEESDELIMFHSIPLNSDDLLELSKSTTYQPINPEEMQESSLSAFRIIFDWFKEHGYQQGHRIARSPVFGSRDTSSRRNSLLVPPKPHEEENTINVDGIASSIRFSNDQEANRYKYLLDAFVILLLRDVDLLFYVFEAEFKSIILHKLIEIPLTYLYEEAKQLCKAINELTNKIYHGKFAFYSLISVIRWFYRSNPLLTQFYQESDLTLSQQQFTNTLLTLFENSLMEYLRLILNEIQNESSPISSNCQVHSLTVHVFDYMEDYLNYESIITTVHKNQNSIVPSCIYMGELYRILCRNIFEKRPESIVYDDSVIRAIFLLNNTTYIFKRIESSSLLSIMELIHPNLKSNIETYIEKSIKIYMKCCSPIITAMQQMFHYDDLHHLPNNQLKDSDRSQLKSNFLMVNTAIDTFRRQNQSYVIDDSQLRDRLRSELKTTILDMFTKYYTKFASKNFTHHPEKYIRYNPSTFNNLIEQLFED
ncbi:hypothetical protein I4U23_012245 [Adineta vaga]|nr:hypothetical protein I4U23_012245 [Adineta vaga]